MSETRPDKLSQRDAFDRISGSAVFENAPKTRPSTFTDVTPILGDVLTVVVQTAKTEDGFVGFVQTIDANGSQRVVLPPKTMQAIYRQRDSLVKRGRSERGKDRWAQATDDEREATVTRLRKTKVADLDDIENASDRVADARDIG